MYMRFILLLKCTDKNVLLLIMYIEIVQKTKTFLSVYYKFIGYESYHVIVA